MQTFLKIFEATTVLLPFSDAPTAATLCIDLPKRRYAIYLNSNNMANPATWQGLPEANTAVIVTNPTIQALYAQQLQQGIAPYFQSIHQVVLPDGEAHKNWESLNLIFDQLLTLHCDRKTVLFALGGGVIGDITGFAASCYMRGIPFVQVPTTLLAQVDSSVGGKTAINHPLGKNMIGAFYQPERVVCDMSTLATLPQREFSAGLAEVIKYGPIADMDFFEWLEKNIDDLQRRSPVALRIAVQRSCEIKGWVVAQDEEEKGMRAILNFGHTFGHAIELGLGFGTWLHGEAVACGMVLAARLSVHLGLIDESLCLRLERLLTKAGLPIRAPVLAQDPTQNVQTWLAHMRGDKKAEAGKIRFVLLARPGQAALATVDEASLAEVITQCSQKGSE